MTDYTLECEQPTVKCRFILVRHEEFGMYIDLTLPELNQVKKGHYSLIELWDKKNPDGDKHAGLYVENETIGKFEMENKNPNVQLKWLPLKIEGEVR